MRKLVAIAMAVAAFGLVACGGDDEGGSDELSEDELAELAEAVEELEENPDALVTGTEVAEPSEAAKCLEGEGFEIEAGGETPAGDGVADEVAFVDPDGGGTGTITYYESEEQAIQARGEGDPVPDSVTGGKGPTNYFFTGEGFEDVSTTILGCL